MNVQNSNNAYLTYNTNPFNVVSSPTLEVIQKRGKTCVRSHKKEKVLISPYNNKFVAFVGLLGTPTKDNNHLDRTKGVVPIVSEEGLCYVHDDNDDQSNIQLKRCDCTLCICDSGCKDNLKCSKCVQAELDHVPKKGDRKPQNVRNKYQNNLELWNALQSTSVGVDTSNDEETDSTFSVDNKNEFKEASISLEKRDDGKIKCKYVVNGKRCYRVSKCGKAWKLEIYAKNANKPKERDVEEEQANIRYGSNKSSFDGTVEEGFVKKLCKQLEEQSGSSTETSLEQIFPVKQNKVTTSLPVVQLYPNNLKKESTQTSLPYLQNNKQHPSISGQSSGDLRYATGQLTSGVVPNELRSHIYTENQVTNENNKLPFHFGNNPSNTSSKKEPNLAIFAYPYSDSCSHMLDKLLESDKNGKGLSSSILGHINCESNCKTMEMIKTLQEKIEAHEKSCPTNCETIIAIKELQKKVDELQKQRVKLEKLAEISVEDKSTHTSEKIVFESFTSGRIEEPRRHVSSQTPSLADGISFKESLIKNYPSGSIKEIKQTQSETCPPSCHENSSTKLQPKSIQSCEAKNISKPHGECLRSCCETSSTDTCPQSCHESSSDGREYQTSSQHTDTCPASCSTDGVDPQTSSQNTGSCLASCHELQPKSSIPKSCPAICQDEAFIKVIHDRIKKYVKSCPSSCFNNSLIKVLQSKIEVLEKSVPKYDVNSKRKLSQDTFGLSELFEAQQSKQILLSTIPNTDEQLHRRVTCSSCCTSDIFGINPSGKLTNTEPEPYLYYQFAPSITLISTTERESGTTQTPDEEVELASTISKSGQSVKKSCCTNEAFMKAIQDKINQYEAGCSINSPAITVLQKKVASLEKALPIAIASSAKPLLNLSVQVPKNFEGDLKTRGSSLTTISSNPEMESKASGKSDSSRRAASLDTISRMSESERNYKKTVSLNTSYNGSASSQDRDKGKTGAEICEKKSNISLCKDNTMKEIPESIPAQKHQRKCCCCSCANALLDKKTGSGISKEPRQDPGRKIGSPQEDDESGQKVYPPDRSKSAASGVQTDEGTMDDILYRPSSSKKNTSSSTDENNLTKSTTIDGPFSLTAEVQTQPMEELPSICKSEERKPKPKITCKCSSKIKQASQIPVPVNKNPPCNTNTCKKDSEPCNVRMCKIRHHTNIPQIFKTNPCRTKPETKIKSITFAKKYEGLRSKLKANNLKTIFSNKALDKSDCCDSKTIKALQNKIDALEKACDVNKLAEFKEWSKKNPPDFCEALKGLREKVEALEKNYQMKPGKKVEQKCPSSSKCHQRAKDGSRKVGLKEYQAEVPKGSTSGGVYKVEIRTSEKPIENMLKTVEKKDSFPIIEEQISNGSREEENFPRIEDQNEVEGNKGRNQECLPEDQNSRGKKIKSFFKKKFKQNENASNKASVSCETSNSSLVKTQKSKDDFDFPEKSLENDNKQQKLMEELGIQRNELRELKTLLQSHLNQIEKSEKNTTILHRATVYENYSKPYETTEALLNSEKLKDDFEYSNEDLITIRAYKNNKSSQTNFEKSKLKKDSKSSQTNFEKSNQKLKLHKKNKSSQTTFEKNNQLELYKHEKPNLTNLGSYKLFKSYPGKRISPQEAKSQSCPDCHKMKICKVKEYSKSEIIQSPEDKKRMPKHRKRKKLWLLMLCKLCFCR